jgi:[calcium/calmodulin-dependent protein kinase] kinase
MLSQKISAYNMVEREMAIMKKMAHPNICKLYEIIDDPEDDKLYLVMEFVKKGSLNSKSYWDSEFHTKGQEVLLVNPAPEKEKKLRVLPLKKLKKYCRDFLLGLDYCTFRLFLFFIISLFI